MFRLHPESLYVPHARLDVFATLDGVRVTLCTIANCEYVDPESNAKRARNPMEVSERQVRAVLASDLRKGGLNYMSQRLFAS